MALIIDHFFRAVIITLGTLVVIPSAGYVPLNKQVLTLNDAPAAPVDNASPSPEDTAKINELNEKIKKLGIDQSCFLGDLKKPKVCELTQEQLKNINLPNKDEDDNSSELTIGGLESPKTVTLTIEANYSTDDFPETLRFTLKNTNTDDVNINGDGGEDTLKSNIDYDYKISLVDGSRLNKAWSSLSHLGRKVGININDSVQNTCTINDHNKKISVWKSETEYVIEADSSVGDQCPMTHEENVAGYLQGFKLKVSGDNDITLTEGEGPTNGTTINKITKNGVSYEIGPKEVNGTKKWFLIERSN